MQIKKFEAPTIQEALDTIKRELGPEAIILQTRKNKRGFGLMSKESVEVTAAVSERSLDKKKSIESRMPEANRELMKKLPAEKQAKFYDKYGEKYQNKAPEKNENTLVDQFLERSAQNRDRVELSKRAAGTRYVDIPDGVDARTAKAKPGRSLPAQAAPSFSQTMGAPSLASGRGSTPVIPPMLEEELRELRKTVEELKSHRVTGGSDRASKLELSGTAAMLENATLSRPEYQDIFEQLVMSGLDKRLAFGLVKKAAFELGQDAAVNPEKVLDQIATEIMASTHVQSPLAGIEAKRPGALPSVIAVVGPTGVGKTTTIAKMASEAILKRRLKVGLINLDSYKVAAFDQLGTYARILNVPFRSVASVDDLKVALQDFQALDLVLVDTTGRSQKDPESLKEMQDFLCSINGLRSQLVISATTRDSELYDIANRFAIFKPQGLTLSKLDEATSYGCIYNVSQKAKLPLLYFTTGQRVPEDIEEASPERVAALILDL
jgi:flagellar biosynthesis protein FlhF